jgi:ABC-type glycerol-3-phosphate transport system substrate-binding protein
MQILYMSTYAPALNDWLTARTLEWAAKKGVDVELSTASYMEILPKILTGVETHNPPDLAFGAGGLIALMAEDPAARSIEPLDDVINEIGKDDLIPPCRKWYTIDGKQWGIDLFLFVDIVHLIKPFADEVGRKPEELVTWDDYIEFAKEVKVRHPDMFPIGHTLGQCYDGTETFWQHSWPLGGGLCTGRSSGQVIFDSNENKQALQRIVDLYNEGLISPQMLQADEMLNNNAYLSRSSAFIIEGPTPFYAAVTRNPKLAGETVLLPPPKGPKGMFTYGSKQALCVFKESKNVDLAKDLLVYIFKDKNAYTTFIKNGYYAAYPVFKSAQENLKSDPIWASYMALESTIVDYTHPLNEPCKGADEANSKFLFAVPFTDVLINHKSVDEAITSVGTQIKDIFKRVYGK